MRFVFISGFTFLKVGLLATLREVKRMSKRYLVAVVACIAILCFCGQRASGQAVGSFQGTVTDKSDAPISGATVTVASQATGAVRTTTTDETGHYNVTFLPPAVYTVRVEFKGFQTTETKDIKLQVDEQRELDFTLALATVSSSVEVTANEVAVETANPTLGQVITSQQVSQLPLNGRDFVQLATLTPGATAETNPNSFFTSASSSEVAARGPFSLSVGGSRPNSTDWLIDGVDNNELTAGGIAILSSIDSIQEFKVLTYNYSAEYGTRAGPTVLLTTKSGSNAFHGSLYEFFRNTDLDARSFFATSTEKFNLNQFGGSFGGPIRKNKTFFFLDGEQKYQRHGIPFTGLVPTEAMRNGDFTADNFGNPVPNIAGTNQQQIVVVNPNMVGTSTVLNAPNSNPNVPNNNIYFQCVPGTTTPMGLVSATSGQQYQGQPCNVIPAGLFNSIGQQMINLYPTPNVTGNTSYNFADVPVRKLDETKFDVRLDQNLSSADTLFGRFSYDQATSYVPGGAPGFAEASAFGSNQGILNHARNVGIGETHIFSPTTVNQFSFGYNRIFDYITSQGTGSCESAKLGIVGANLGCPNGTTTCTPGAYSCGLVSTLMTAGYWSLGDRGYTPFQGGTNIFTVNDSIDMIRGKHDIHFGIGIRANQMNVGTEAFQDGFWIPGAIGNFTGYSGGGVSVAGNPEADFLLGLTGVSEHDQTFNGPVTGRRWKIYRPFVQDDWRVTKDLTLNLGLAWDITNPITEVDGRMANYDITTNQLLVAGQNGVSQSAGVQKNWTAFEPRVGMAWKLLGSDKTVLRAGYAIYHDSAWSMGAQGLWQNPPFFAEGDLLGFAQQSGITFGTTPVGCPSTTSYCASIPNGNAVTGASINAFPIYTTPPNLSTFTGTLFYQPTNFKLAKVQQFNVNMERQIPGNIVLTVGYAGARGDHILVAGNNINTNSLLSGNGIGPTACGTVTSYTLGCNADGSPYVSPIAVGNAVLEFGDLGKTTYDSLQIKAETKTPKYGLYALIGYTYSKTYDNGLTDGLGSLLSAPYFPLPNWQKLDWALSQINLNNSFTASVIYDLPFGRGKRFGNDWNNITNSILGGWQVTVIEKITSGFPDPLIDSSNQSGVTFNNGGNGNNFNRPDQVAGCNVYSASHSQQQYINASCFVAPPPGQLGNANRASVYGPDFVNTDFSVIKQFALPWESMGLNFRAEFFNLFNHAQFGLPVNDINAPGFGSVNSTVNNPRVIQFGLKLTF
jgi:Carboxypeptidase regulatory-like domain